MSRLLQAAEDASPVQAVEAVTRELRAAERVERRDAEESAEVLPFDGGPAERALRTQTVQVLPPDLSSGLATGQGWTVLAPVTERGETLGLLEMSLPTEPDEFVLADIVRTAHVLAFVVIANGRHTDLFEWGQRSVWSWSPTACSSAVPRRWTWSARSARRGVCTHERPHGGWQTMSLP